MAYTWREEEWLRQCCEESTGGSEILPGFLKILARREKILPGFFRTGSCPFFHGDTLEEAKRGHQQVPDPEKWTVCIAGKRIEAKKGCVRQKNDNFSALAEIISYLCIRRT